MMQHYYEQWKQSAPIGLVLIGAGFSLTAHAATLRGKGAPLWKWVLLGTVGLVVLNSGIAVFGDAVKQRALYEMHLDRLNS